MVKINKIDLYNYRCYSTVSYDFKDNINIIEGNNATGKTSLVEAIYMLGMCKSFRTSSEADVLKNGTDFYCINAKIEDLNSHQISITYNKEGKKVSCDGNTFKSLSDYIGILNIVAFSPEDLKLIKGDPKSKRRFLDLNIGQINKQYLNDIISYNKLLKERNELLKRINYNGNTISNNDKNMLNIISSMLIEKGIKVIQKRNDFIQCINTYICKYVQEISNNREKGYIEYKPNVKIEDYTNEIKIKERNDLFAQTTTCGPHKDDFIVYINEMNASTFGSQGQQKTLALAIKLALAEYITDLDKNVIIILDDVFGELDENRQKDLLRILKNDKQIFITTTSSNILNKEVLDNCKIIKLDK